MRKKYRILLLPLLFAAGAALLWFVQSHRSPGPDTIANLVARLQDNPTNADLHERLANLLLNAGQSSAAMGHFQSAIQYAPEKVSARASLAGILAAQGQTLEAQKLLESNLKLSPKDPATNEILGNILMQTLGEKTPDVAFPIAARYFDTALQGDPTRAVAALGLSRIFLSQGKLSDAAGALQKALAAHHRNAALHLQMANILALDHRYNQASPEFDAGTALDPKNSEALCTWGVMLIDAGRPEAAELVLRRALELEPKNPEFHMHLARALRDERISIEDAMKEFEKAIDCDPKYGPVYVEIANTLLKVHDATNDARAERFLRDAIIVAPSYTPAKIALARLLTNVASAGQQNLWEAADLLHKCVLETNEQDVSLLVGYADALANVKVYDLAVEQMDKAIAWGKTHGLKPEQMEILLTRRQNYFLAQTPLVEGHQTILQFAVEGMTFHDPVDDPWPFPKQPTVQSLLLLPWDLGQPPAPGSLLDAKFYMGESLKTPLGF